MKKKSLSMAILSIISILTLLSNSLINAHAQPITDAWFRFTIQTAGSPGTLTFYRIKQGVVYDPISWSATSGDNIPDHLNQRNVGPIPAGRWFVYPENSANPDGTNPPSVSDGYYPIYWDENTNRYGRDGFYIHRFYTVSRGCICIHGSDSWANFKNWVNSWFSSTPGLERIRLIVSYPSTNTTGVGGIMIHVNKFGLLAPYIGLASALMVATVASVVYAKRVKRKKVREI